MHTFTPLTTRALTQRRFGLATPFKSVDGSHYEPKIKDTSRGRLLKVLFEYLRVKHSVILSFWKKNTEGSCLMLLLGPGKKPH